MSSSSSSRPRRPLRWVLIVLILIAVALAGYWLLRDDADDSADTADAGGTPAGAPQASAVSAVTASRGDLPIRLTALGTVRPLASVEVRPRVEGELTEVSFEEGEVVEKGQVLARIDPRDYEAQRAQAQGQLEQDQAQLASAKEDLARYNKLIETNYVSRQELEQQRQLVRQYEGTVASDRASLESTEVQVDYTRITAPITGVVGIRNVDPGNIVQLGNDDPIVTITQLDPISVIFSLPSRYVDTLRERLASGDRPTVTVTTAGGKTHSGELASLDSRINSTTGTLRMRATLDNPDGALYPNAYVDVSLVSQILRDRLIVPEPAVQTGQDGNYVYVVNADDSVSQRSVTLVANQRNRSVIEGELEAGDRVVVDGVDNLRDGAKVRVVSNALPGEASDEESAAGETTPAANDTDEDAGTP
ncbi:efflux RND transporter periplasmic adaptor subunit [Salinicola halophilus]|uniref:efflux RND transporter periplasmic adaptor subunit n=1 Tax=Salinicola halophilus TaxID=184065 RepID=UPI000DA21582|nr:efflux RND transporter periplasmic adaptor subunit [Salinicola halophilus]